MTIRQKIKLSNIMMALIPIAMTAIIVAVCLQTSLGSYWYTLETMYKDENGIQSAQSLIYTYQQELWENNWGQGTHTGAVTGIRKNEKMNHLEEKLSKMGYHFLIRKDGNEIYSNISEEEIAAAESVAGTAIESAKTLTASYHDVSVIKHTFFHGEKAFSIIAVHTGETDQGVISYLQNYILKYILGFIIAFLVLTVCVNGILSCWISKSVLVPLQKLSRGTKEIRDGNLDTEIDYSKPDEFGEVCRDFGLSEYNRLDSTSFRYHLEPADLKGFIGHYLTSYEEEARQNQVKFEFMSEPGDFPVLLDKTEMKRVLDNLFTNTIRYRGQPQSNVAISLRRVEHSTVVEFIFSDDGPGVPDESLDRIFESFYRVDGARRNAGEGSGIGLAVVKEIISGHRGIVHAENHGGLAIIIHLPMTEES